MVALFFPGCSSHSGDWSQWTHPEREKILKDHGARKARLLSSRWLWLSHVAMCVLTARESGNQSRMRRACPFGEQRAIFPTWFFLLYWRLGGSIWLTYVQISSILHLPHSFVLKRATETLQFGKEMQVQLREEMRKQEKAGCWCLERLSPSRIMAPSLPINSPSFPQLQCMLWRGGKHHLLFPGRGASTQPPSELGQGLPSSWPWRCCSAVWDESVGWWASHQAQTSAVRLFCTWNF